VNRRRKYRTISEDFRLRFESGREFWLTPARLIPQGELDAVPEAELVVDDTEIILHHVFCGADFMSHVAVLQTLGDKLDDTVFTLAGCTGSITLVCKHNCLR
jgi:hypothetical protein